MRKTPVALAAGLALTACSTTPSSQSIDVDAGLAARTLEITLDADGNPAEIEYHIDPAQVPERIRKAMDALHPGGPYTDAEREWHDGVLCYELNRLVSGREVEAMFAENGALFSEEIEVGREKVPSAVHRALAERFPVGVTSKYEEIRDGARSLVEYHVKLVDGGVHYKVALDPEGPIVGIWTETPAEIEIPVR